MKNLLLAGFIILLFGCKSPDLVMSPDLKQSAEAFDVKGKQGWQINQVISFGGFHSSKIKKGWVTHLDLEFLLRFKNASQKLSFTQFSPEGNSAEVFAVSKFHSSEIPLLGGFLSFSYKYKDAFAATIASSNNGVKSNWDFIIYNMGDISAQSWECGEIRNLNGSDVVEIKGVNQTVGSSRWDMKQYAGFEFFYKGESVAAVSRINNGKVWLKKELPADLKLVLASASTAILSRPEMDNNKK